MARSFKPTYNRGQSTSKAYGGIRKTRIQSRQYRTTVKRNQPNYKTLRKNAGEKKGVDTLIGGAAILNTTNTNGSCTVLNLIQTGNGSWNRVGKQVYLKSIRIKGDLQHVTITGGSPFNSGVSSCRMVLVWDKQPSGAAIPTWDAVFGYTDQTGAELSTTQSQPRYDNMGRFKVLRDIVYIPTNALSNVAVASNTITTTVPIDEYVKLGNKMSVYLGQSTPMTIADVSTGALYLYFRETDSSADTTWATSANMVTRLRYSD